MSDYFLGEIRLMAFSTNRVPRDFALCQGQTLTISGNEALYAVIGTTYGGDGRTNFKLPDLRGRVPVHMGQGPNLSNYVLGQTAGLESVTLGISNLPAHTHTASVSNKPAVTLIPSAAVVQGDVGAGVEFYCNVTQAGATQTFASDTVSASNNSVASPNPHSNIQPTMPLNYIICTNGLYPSNN